MPTYSKAEGGLQWKKDGKPTHAWYNGTVKRYLLGDRINERGVTELTKPVGTLNAPAARISPFKISRARQISDKVYKYLIAPQLWEGFWKHGDWYKASEEGIAAAELIAGLPGHVNLDTVPWVIYTEP